MKNILSIVIALTTIFTITACSNDKEVKVIQSPSQTGKLDTDGDGLSDEDEIKLYSTSPKLADTDGDGFSDFKEIVTLGFSAEVNNLRFNPLIADLPQIDVQLTSAPDISLNYTTSDGTSKAVSTARSQSSSQSITTSETLEESTSFEHSHTSGFEIGIEKSIGTDGIEVKASASLNYSKTSAFGKETSQAWTDEQSKENSTALEKGEEFETSNSIDTSGGGLSLSVKLNNGGNISYTLSNLFLSATYLDLSQNNPIVPIGNLKFENSNQFPKFTLAPGESSTHLNFSSSELGIDTTKLLLKHSDGLVIKPATFDLLDENGVSFTFNNTDVQSLDALVIVDFAGLNGLKNLSLMVATNNVPDKPGLSIKSLLDNVLRLTHETDEKDGYLKSLEGINNSEPAGRWVMVHGKQKGNNQINTTVYTSPDDLARTQKLNAKVSNLVSTYKLDDIRLRGGDILHLVYLLDDDQDGISNREEQVYGTDPFNPDTDSDKLTDGAEVNGWQISYKEAAGAIIKETVRSNPLKIDSDGDGLTDFQEANLSNSDIAFRRNPQSVDTDGDGLNDHLDDKDASGDLAANQFDNLDIDKLTATLKSNTVFPSDVDVTYDTRDVTEKGAGKIGNGISGYQVHVYRHIANDGNHPKPTTPPINFAPALQGQTLDCGTGCTWELVHISNSLPGASTQSFTDSQQINAGQDFKYIAYLRVNDIHTQSQQIAFSSANIETIKVHVLAGDGNSQTQLRNVRTIADEITTQSTPEIVPKGQPPKRIEYSAEHNEVFVGKGTRRLFYFRKPYTRYSMYGRVYNATTGKSKKQNMHGNKQVMRPYEYHYNICPRNDTEIISGNCWIRIKTPYHVWQHINGYITDSVYANDVDNLISHPLGKGDSAFTLDWSLHINGIEKTKAPSTKDSDLRHICTSYRHRNQNDATRADFKSDLKLDAVDLTNTNYIRSPKNYKDTDACDGKDVFADTDRYSIDGQTGGAVFTHQLPAQPGCYRIRLTAREFDRETRQYNAVSQPVKGQKDYDNIDEAELCRDNLGIWTIKGVQLDSEHQLATQATTATVANNPNFINYTTRPLIWKDERGGSRTTMQGQLKVNYLIEVVKP